MEREEVRAYDNAYCKLRDMQFAAYEFYARKHALTAKELFVLEIFSGLRRTAACSQTSATGFRQPSRPSAPS